MKRFIASVLLFVTGLAIHLKTSVWNDFRSLWHGTIPLPLSQGEVLVELQPILKTVIVTIIVITTLLLISSFVSGIILRERVDYEEGMEFLPFAFLICGFTIPFYLGMLLGSRLFLYGCISGGVFLFILAGALANHFILNR